MSVSRRTLLLGTLAAAVGGPALASAPTARQLAFVNLHTGD